MQRTLFLLLIFTLLFGGAFLVHQHRTAVVYTPGCTDIPASPDYLSTNSEQDAIAAINNARQLEHLHPLHLPANFYRLDPVQQQFLLVNLERTDRNLRPLQMDANLSQIAYAYSKQLLKLNFFSHTSPISGTFSDRVNSNSAIASHYNQAAENLAGNPVPGAGSIYEYMYNDSIEQCAHRKNILDPELALVGIGLIRGGTYGSVSAQEFIASAPWNPYVAVSPNRIAPHITISIAREEHSSIIHCRAFTQDNTEVVRITWFIDSIGHQPQIGPLWTLDLSQFSPGKHTILAFAVDGEQNYGMARYTIEA